MKNNKDDILWQDRKRHFGLPISFTKYYIDNDRLYMQTGFLKTEINETLLYRIMDIKSTRSLGQKVFGVGTVTLNCADQTNPVLELKNVKNAKKVHRFISDIVEKERVNRNIAGREMVGASGAVLYGEHADNDISDIDETVSFEDFQ